MDQIATRGAARRDFFAGVITMAPAWVASMPIGLVLGALAAQKGLSPLEMFAMSTAIYAGGAQFVALDLWSEPASWVVLGFSALLVNVRHVMMGASLARSVGHFSSPQRWATAFLMSDEVWAMAEQRAARQAIAGGKLTPAFYFGLGVSLYLNWVLWSTMGAILGAFAGNPAAYGFDFVFSAIFIGLIAGFPKSGRRWQVLAASGGAAALVYLQIDGPWYVLSGGLAGILVALLLPDIDEVEAST